jgi:two-component system, LuxR family, sensor kinase FixL
MDAISALGWEQPVDGARIPRTGVITDMNAIGESRWIGQIVLGRSSRLSGHWPRLRGLLEFGLFVTAFYFAYLYGMSFSHACASPFWFPDSVLLCALLLNRPQRWWLFVLAPLPIRLLVAVPPGTPSWFLLATFAIDSLKGLLTAAALRRFVRNPLHLETVRAFSVYCLFAVLLVPLAAAFAGAAVRHRLGHDFWPSWEQWFMGDALTQLIITPAILFWILRFPWQIRMPEAGRRLEAVLLATGLILTGYAAFHTKSAGIGLTETRFYAPVPFLFWAAIRFGMFGAAGAAAIIAFVAVEAALAGHGLFSGLSPNDTARVLQQFLFLRVAPLYLVAILIEQRTGVERSLRESEARFRDLSDTAPVMIWMSGPDGRRNYFNRRWMDFTGRSREAEVGEGWIDGVHPEDKAQWVTGFQRASDSREPFTLEYRLLRHDGNYRWILAQAIPRLTAGGELIGYVGSCQDITDRKWAEEGNRNLAHAQRLAVMGELTAMIAHEINQPLGAILSNADAAAILIQEKHPPLQDISEILEDIRASDLRASDAIGRIRTLLRKREMEMQPLDLNETVSDVLRFVAGDALRHRVQLQKEFAISDPMVIGDRVHLQQVLLNLIVNGMQAMTNTPETARRLTVRTALKDSRTVAVSVSDTGHGIPSDKLGLIFESFFTTKKDGMGLGLSIAQSIIQAHGGRVRAANDPAGGAEFHFTLPLMTGANRQAPTKTTQPANNPNL